MDKQTILDRLDIKTFYFSELPSFKANGSGIGQALCPFHEDTRPSLTVNLITGQFKCFGCNKKGSIFDFYMSKHAVDYKTAFNALAKEAGITQEKPRKIIKAYDYVDESGTLIFQTVRYEPKDFRQRRPDGKGGYIYDLKGVSLIPYNFPEVIKAKSVMIVEGEKDVETLRGIGLVASCNPMGAGKWREEYNRYFTGKKVAIIPDNDKPGRDHALQVAKTLKGVAESVKVVELPGLPEKGDVSDWIEAGGTKERLVEIIKKAPETELSKYPDMGGGQLDNSIPEPFSYLKKGSDLRQLDITIEWAIDKLLPRQSITLLHGRGGIGKTWISLILADVISRGIPFMGLNSQRMDCIFVDFENSLPVLVDRVRKIGIEDVLFWHNSNEILKPPKLDRNEWELYKSLPSASLLIFDTLRASQGQDENDSQRMAFIMSRLKELRDVGFTILLLHHTPKGNDRTYKGSTAILDLADHVLSLHKVKRNNPEGGELEDDEDQDCLYRLGTKDKTRYEPFHIFMAFDKEKGFIKALDPDEENLQAIYELLKEQGRQNQSEIYESVKDELNIRSKGKVSYLLRKGEGRYWKSHKVGRAVYYEAIVLLSDPIYSESGQIKELSEIKKTDTIPDDSQTLDNSQLSNCPGVSQTVRTDTPKQDERCSCCLLIPGQRKICEVVKPCPKEATL